MGAVFSATAAGSVTVSARVFCFVGDEDESLTTDSWDSVGFAFAWSFTGTLFCFLMAFSGDASTIYAGEICESSLTDCFFTCNVATAASSDPITATFVVLPRSDLFSDGLFPSVTRDESGVL